MENNKGNGIFLGVIGVATLVVAIIGATFAFFSAQASSDNNAVNVAAYEFATKVDSVTRVYPVVGDGDTAFTNGMIPLLEEKLATAIASDKKCIDSNGRMVCVVYKATLSNNSVREEKLNFAVETIVNTAGTGGEAFSNLKLQSLGGTPELFNNSGEAQLLKAENPLPSEATSTFSDVTITVPAKSEGAGTVDHYFVVYLEEPVGGETDQSKQMGAKYAGKLIYSTGDGANKVTGTFKA